MSFAFSTPAFGAAPATATTPAFGAATPAATPAFGAPPAAGAAPAAATPATSLFGGAAAAAPSPFGGAALAAPSPFGAAPAPAAVGGALGALGGGIGAAMPGSTFGGLGSGGGLFGAAPAAAPALGTGAFGAPGGGLFGAAPAAAPGATAGLAMPGGAAGSTAGQDSMDGEIFAQWQQQMLKAWDDKDYKLSSFKYVFFEDLSQAGTDGMMAPPAAEELHRKRAASLAASDTGMWERADGHNPDPSRFCPIQVTGFNALHERRNHQLQAARDLAAKLKESQDVIRSVEDERTVAIDLRFRYYVERQQMLAHRVLRLYAAIERQHLLRCHGGVEPPLSQAEYDFIQKLRGLSREMEQPGGLSRLYQLSTQLQQEATAAGQLDGLPSASRVHLENLQGWLTHQQEAVRTLIKVNQQDLADLGIACDIAKGS